MKQHLGRIYRELAAGRLSQQAALEAIKALQQPVRSPAEGSLLATTVWEPAPASVTAAAQYRERHVILCGLPSIESSQLARRVPQSICSTVEIVDSNIARAYSNVALACFTTIQRILKSKPRDPVLIQIAAANRDHGQIFAGLSGMLETAALENPHLQGQIVLVETEVTAAELAQQLREQGAHFARVVSHGSGGGARMRRRWQVIEGEPATPNQHVFKEHGVYLITGGLGGLGTLFAREIQQRTSNATIILTGRSALTEAKHASLQSLRQQGRVDHRQLDVSDLAQVTQLLAAIKAEHGRLNGIIHSAGVLLDDFILKKSAATFSEVLSPKVAGTCNLDLASESMDLDFLWLFSSIASWAGNVGQADYAAANGFLDEFAGYRNRLVAAGQRKGHTLAIGWPHWLEGGMNIDAASMTSLQQRTGLRSLRTEAGMAALYRSVALSQSHVMVMAGDAAQMRRALLAEPSGKHEALPAPQVAVETSIPAGDLLEQTRGFLRKEFSMVLKIPTQRIDTRAPLENYGIDSILAMSLTNQLEATFGALAKTLFFEYLSIDELAGYFVQAHANTLAQLFSSSTSATRSERARVVTAAPAQRSIRRIRQRYLAASQQASTPSLNNEPIAIVGLSGRYPESRDIEQFWINLRDGKDCIVEIPRERWDWRQYYSEDRSKEGAHFSKWGGFIAGADEFDPRFFNIAPREAPAIDPQERLFLQHAWLAIEDAGLTRASLRMPHKSGLPGQVGVYAGVMYGEYNLSGSLASIANRVSYFLNLHGPSLTLDTMCSSSLTAIHLACQDLRLGRTNLAIAGGVNVSIHPNKYRMLSGGQFLSGDGHCQSFGEGGDGYIPGEGVGVAILKRLADAARDGNHIYGVIKGSALNHGGKTNGYTVPNPQAQADVIRQALAEANIDPRQVSYIEAHGTGTKLGDPIEIAALTKAFNAGAQPRETGFCRIGSAKSNIGHCESAAGIAGITKVLLQMKHRSIVPSLHSRQLNPHIDFKTTPFVVNQMLTPWEQPEVDGRRQPRIAGISSFGAGGSNAHVIIEEYQPATLRPAVSSPVIIPLSARTSDQLQQRARELAAFIARQEGGVDLQDMAFTLQTGREAMEDRVAFVVSSVDELVTQLDAFAKGVTAGDCHRSQVKHHRDALITLSADANFQVRVEQSLAQRRLAEVAELWVKGWDLEWRRLVDVTPRLISLPGYPFATERYWIEPPAVTAVPPQPAVMHPLLHVNTSNLLQQSYTSRFTGTESFLVEDSSSAKVLPPSLALEMIRAAVELASPKPAESGAWEIREIVWDEPIVVSPDRTLCTALFARGNDEVDVEIHSSSGAGENADESVHCQSHVVFNRQSLSASAQPMVIEMDAPVMAASELREIPPAIATKLISGQPENTSAEAPASLQKPTGIALLADTDMRVWRPTARAPVTLSNPQLPSSAVEPAVAASVRRFDRGNGVLAIEIAGAFANAIDPLQQALNRCQQESSAKVLLLRGNSEFWQGNTATGERVLERQLLTSIASFSYPIIAVAPHGALGSGLLLAAACDFVVCNEAGQYGLADRLPSSTEERFLRERFGADLANQLCREELIAGRQLKARGWACRMVPASAVESDATQLAAALANKPEVALRLLKMHLSRYLLPLMGDANEARVEATQQAASWSQWPIEAADKSVTHAPGAAIPLRSSVVTAVAHAEGVVVVTMQDRDAKNMFSPALVSGLKEVFEHIERTPTYKAVVLCGYDSYFATGGTRETLLAIQEGQAQFTDEKVFQLPMECSLPVIAAIQGHGIGGGWSFGMFADVILLSEESRYLSPYMGYGFTPGAGSTLVFPKKIGYDLARETLLTAKEMTGSELKERGIRLPVLPRKQVLSAAISMAKRIAENSRERLQDLKRQWTQPLRDLCEETYRREVAMHEHTFVKQASTLANIRARFAPQASQQPASAAPALPSAAQPSSSDSIDAIVDRLKGMLAKELHLRPAEIEETAQFIDLGLDSITGVTWVRKINEHYGTHIEATKVYSHPTLREISRHVRQEAEQAGTLSRSVDVITAPAESVQALAARQPQPTVSRTKLVSWRRSRTSSRFAVIAAPAAEQMDKALQPIAVVGMAGQFPKARDLDQFWSNLAEGRNCIDEISDERWHLDSYFQQGSPTPGKTNSKWLGALDDYDRFDPLFFNISPTEAECMDPQQRVFLQACWHAIENAGYNPQSLSGSQCGVFVGCGASDYQQLAPDRQLSAQGFTGAATSILAARISYFLNLRGPCVSLDTACSSSLVAIANACDSLNAGNSDVALAGGVYVMGGPAMHIMTAQAGMLSTAGRCFTFDQRANGFVPGEGVGVVMLKRLADAERDGDSIQAVVQGWGVNQDGRTNGITAPNEDSQTRLLQSVYRKFAIDPAGIQLIEAHGTGTKLGDPIEIAGLKAAFKVFTDKADYCAIGSVKSNIGHCLTAAGAAGFIKLILALQHRQLPATINFERCNEHIQLAGSPFYVNGSLRDWKVGEHQQRRAAISSFGFSGTNAHIVIGEHLPPVRSHGDVSAITQDGKLVVCLSARTEAQLKQRAHDLLAFVRGRSRSINLLDVAYTSQVGREPMGERVAFLVDSLAALTAKLTAYAGGEQDIDDVYQGQVKRHKEGMKLISQDEDVRATIVEKWLGQRKLSKLVDLWVKGLDLDWNLLYGAEKPKRIELPNYPFAKERYWLAVERERPVAKQDAAPLPTLQHDKISYVSRWEEQPSVVQVLPAAHEKVLIVCTDASFGFEAAIRAHHEQHRDCEVLLVRVSDETGKVSATEWLCGAQDEQGFETCLRDCGHIDALYFLATTEREPGDLSGLANQEHNEIQLLRLVKYLKQHARIDGRIDAYILTLDNHPLDGRAGHCWGAGAAGLGYSLAQGNHQFRVRNLDLSPDDLRDAKRRTALMTAITREPASDRGEVFKLQAGHRYRRAFLPLQWDKAGPSALKQHGVYVIVGGGGIVGQVLTRSLLQKYRAHVIWLGRSDSGAQKIQSALQTFKEFGGQLQYLQADVLSPESLRHALNLIKRRHERIHGGIFAGMVFGIENSIDRTTEAEFRAILEVKTRGSRVFFDALRDEPLDFMCYFSSGQAYSFSGAAKLSAYAAGISLADSFVRSIRGVSAFSVGSINWGFWKSAVKERIEKLDGVSTRSLDALEDAEGFERFERFVSELHHGRLHQVLCMRASREVESLMNCKGGEFVALSASTASAAAFPADSIEIPQQRIGKLMQAGDRAQLSDWFGRLLFAQLNRLVHAAGQGIPQTESELRRRCKVIEKYAPWLHESLSMLAEAGFIELNGSVIQGWRTQDAEATWAQWQSLKQQYSGDADTRALTVLIDECLEKLPDILQGKVLATDVIFPNASMDKVAGLYRNNATADTFNEIVASAVLAYLRQRLAINPHARLRILEVGAGTGGTSAVVFAKLSPFKQSIERYCYTDISKAFFFHAEQNYLPEQPYMVCQRLDIEQPIEAQGIEIGSYDLVIATNALHATQDIRKTLRNAKAALRKDGFIILNEMSDKSLATHLTFGLLDGWWLFQDAELRIPGSPGLYPATWQRVLEGEGFESVLLPASEAQSLGNQVIVARSDGVVRLQVPVSEAKPDAKVIARSASKAPQSIATASPTDVAAYVRSVIFECLSATLKIPSDSIEPDIAFSDYGIDSILGVSFIDQLNSRFAIALNTAIIFEYSSVERLGRHVVDTCGKQIAGQRTEAADAQQEIEELAAEPELPSQPVVEHRTAMAKNAQIAIIGMSGQFPKAANVREFWDNLIRGVDGVDELPPRYLNQATHFSAAKQKGKTRCKWGGILADRDCFDPLFFNISPKEAESMNPHQRLVMQESWNAIEDAGYNPKQLSGTPTGIFIGAEPAGYIGDTFTGLSDAIIASRLSYALNFNGPAFVVNTGCSSSAVAIHLACESLRNRESALVVAGGVNACMHQNIQVRLDEIEMLSPSGRCFTFDKAGDGTIISEGIGMIVLKRLDDAIAAGDHIHATLCGSGMNQDGASNGITAPNGAAQEHLITQVYDRFGIDPEAISYVEAHGTGTRLGDPIETNALVRAFRKYSAKTGWCAVGSAKSHIGHAAAAAGVIGIIKVLLSMQHRQLPKLLNFRNLNPLIEFDGSPFFITTETSQWRSPAGVPRMAAINSFGHSGTNVHLVVKEYLPPAGSEQGGVSGNVIIPLSAKTAEQLRQKCEGLLHLLDTASVDLASLSYTLQVGREAMEERLGFIVDSVAALKSKLHAYLNGEKSIADTHLGQAKRSHEIAALIGNESQSSLLEQWVKGRTVDWHSLWPVRAPARISLPGYPFAKERYWIDTALDAKAPPTHSPVPASSESIEDIINKIDDDSLAVHDGVRLLRKIV